MIKKLWWRFTDTLGKTIFHPQYFLKNYEYQAVVELKKRARGVFADIGCGRQPYKKELVGKVKKYIGIDHPITSQKYKYGESPDLFADATDIPLPDNYCDCVSMISVLEHLPNPEQALNEAARIMKQNSDLILIAPQNYPLHDLPYDFFRYTRFGLKALLNKTGFKIIKIKPLGNYPVFAGQMFNIFILKKIEELMHKNLIWKLVLITLLPFILLACLSSNILSLFISNFIKDYQIGSFSICNLVVAKKSSF
jgi:ubiquinone/menaquinone biosynthesis C-methylase UbiE